MVRVKIDNDWYLSIDNHQFSIEKQSISTEKKTGKKKANFSPHGHFRTLEKAIEHLVHLKLAKSKVGHLYELVDEMHDIREWIHQVCAGKHE